MFTRPFFKKGIAELEKLFEENRNDAAFLDLLLAELSFRKTQRSQVLKRKAQQARLTTNKGSYVQLNEPKIVQEKNSAPLSELEKPPVTSQSLKPAFIVKPKILSHPTVENDPNNVLLSWTAMEVLSPPSFRQAKDLAGGDQKAIAQLNKEWLPWERGGEKSRPNYRLYYQIVLGSIDMLKATSALLEVYGDNRVEMPRAYGEAILATIMLDRDGRPVETDPVAISSFGWGLSVALNGKLEGLGQWSEVEQPLMEGLKDKIVKFDDEDGEVLPLDHDGIIDAYNWLLGQIKLPDHFTKAPSFAVRVYQYYKIPDPPEPLILNSFFLEDLDWARKMISARQTTPNLERYLGIVKPENRKDMLNDKTAIAEALEPQNFPSGSWPGKGLFPLALLQQCAVNLALKDLETDGIMAVNGPPGTGKTTLLRDVIAALVTNRAVALCKFDDPEEAFIDSGDRIKKNQASVKIYKLAPEIKGYEMIVASSNNKAVENVSAELPAQQAIAEESTLRYFKTVSDKLLERDSWGAIAAVLGNSKNRSEFRQKFWWNEDHGLQKYFQEVSGNPQFIREKTDTGEIERKPHVIVDEDAPEDHEEALQRWDDVRSEFLECLEAEQSALSDLEEIHHLLQLLEEKQAEAKQLSRIISSKKLPLKGLLQEVEKLQEKLEEQKHRTNKAQQEYDIIWAKRPGFFYRLFGMQSYRIWKGSFDPRKKELVSQKKLFTDLSNELETKQLKVSKIQDVIEKKQISLDKLNNVIKNNKNSLKKLKDQYPGTVISKEFFKKSHSERQKSAPWLDNVTAGLRNEVFEAAMELHKAFVDCAAKPIRHNMNVLMDCFGMRSLGSDEKDALIPDLWSTLFLLVPVISTTFASVSRMFKKIGPEAFGWLLIDEAGQALPQAAVGALIRTKRAIIVGDPMQIEPVVVLPKQLTETICRQFGVDPVIYNAPEASVQTLADSATKYYATFETTDGERQVGVPLLVHRRCTDPMFRISNSIAYDNMMVQAKIDKSSDIRDILGPSCWFHIEGQGEDKWCQKEGQKILSLLQELKEHNVKPDLYIVTPFVVVQDNMRKMLIESNLLADWVTDSDPRRWVYEHVGTVHTVQGREAEAVFFILGAPNAEQTGARNWAGGRPNLLNVAATRAKEALYVIGNRKLWKKAGVFQTLDKYMNAWTEV
ncbi:AAA family ATPase [Bartonella sp. W8097]|uniref:DEAD/DEAH box helicase n=1 Tax=Bartonella apihabitans TaxID=2750929 RepID=UPI0018DE57F4|nr:ATP-binding protein [Bartonella apihabitans]MBI0021613.1 AAA family ATPase [Bartonella apihabitans]